MKNLKDHSGWNPWPQKWCKGLEMQQYIDISPYRDTLNQWYSIDTILIVSIYRISGYIEYHVWYMHVLDLNTA